MIRKIMRFFRNLLPKKKGRYINIHEAREIQKHKEYFGKRKY